MREGNGKGLPEPDRHPESLRESNKADKQRRICIAAAMLLARQGYDETTLRQIAREAHVALGTLSLYADDKRDLALMIFVEKAGCLNGMAEAAARKPGDPSQQANGVFFAFSRLTPPKTFR